jgi:hypothetical protein
VDRGQQRLECGPAERLGQVQKPAALA